MSSRGSCGCGGSNDNGSRSCGSECIVVLTKAGVVGVALVVAEMVTTELGVMVATVVIMVADVVVVTKVIIVVLGEQWW